MDATLQADPRIQIVSNHRNMWCFSQSGTTLRAAAIFVHMAGLMKPTNSPIVYIFHLEWAFIHGCKACAVRDFPFVDLFLFGQVKTVHCVGSDLRDCNHLKYLGQPVVVKLFCRILPRISRGGAAPWLREASLCGNGNIECSGIELHVVRGRSE